MPRSDPASDAVAAVWDEAFYPLATGTWTRADTGTVVVGSLTKVFACPGLRAGYVVAPESLCAAFAKAAQTGSNGSPQITQAVVADSIEWPAGQQFDGVLVDAPCASTGTIRRHPDVAWLRQEPDIGALTGLQQRLLQKAAALVRPGGVLVYCTCSLEPEEGEHAVANFLAAEPAMRRVPIEPGEVAGLAEILNTAGDLRTLPCHLPHADPRLGGLDGFYAARLVKS